MSRFIAGFVSAVVITALAALLYLRLGFVDPRADAPISKIEERIAMPSLDASVARRAGNLRNPVEPNDANLMTGMKLYQAHCASCHGDVNQPQTTVSEAFYPRAPQFVEDPPDMPENQSFYIIQHGVRLSGMPAWGQSLSEQQIWEVTAFLSHMNALPPAVSNRWKVIAPIPEDNDLSTHPRSPDNNMKRKRSM